MMSACCVEASLTKRAYERPINTIQEMVDEDVHVHSLLPYAQDINMTTSRGALARHIKEKETKRMKYVPVAKKHFH